MCSFLFTSVELADTLFTAANFRQRFRGPDLTTSLRFKSYCLAHNLLSITGDFTSQPFIDGDYACLFNGEIYNYESFGEFSSDGGCIIPTYKQFGLDFLNQLDGEFAICLLDAKLNKLVLATDPFATKPLHFAVESGQIGVSSYRSALAEIGFENISKLPANTLVEIGLRDFHVKITRPVLEFDLCQYKTHYDDWISAFENSITKRTAKTREQIFIGLSSGYDSGAIACELLKQQVNFKAYSFFSNEDEVVLYKRRHKFVGNAYFERLKPDVEERKTEREFITANMESGRYCIYSSGNGILDNRFVHEDPAATGLAIICARAGREGRKIYLSGQGSDEIMSDYGFNGRRHYDHSNFGGLFPKDLSGMFPWPSFYSSTQESYLMKEEYVAGSYAIETRYPFLDKAVVQEFLHLDSMFKNSHYKAPLRKYLLGNNFPTAFDVKSGFVP